MSMKKLIHVKQIAKILDQVVDTNGIKGQTGYDGHDGLTIDFDGVFGHFDGVRVALEVLISDEVTARQNADTSLQSGLSTEVNRALAAELVLSNAISAEITDRAADVNTEASRALGQEAAIRSEFAAADAAALTASQVAASAEQTARIAAEAAIQADVDQNEADADAAIAAEESRALAAEGANASAITAEVGRASAAEGVLSGAISTEETRARAAEVVNANAITSEATRATGIESGLQSQISDILSNTDASALDSLTEIVTAFQGADGNLNSAITALAASHTSELTALAADVDTNELDGDNDRALIRSEFATADTALQGNIDTEATAARAAEAANATAISTEATRALAAESVLSAAISAEEASRIAADATTLASAKAYADAGDFAEEGLRITADNALTSALAVEVLDRIAGDDAIVNSEATYSDLKLVGDELRAIAANAGGSGRAMNFYKEKVVTNNHVSNTPQGVSLEMIFGLPTSVIAHSNTTQEKMNMQQDQAYSSFFVAGTVNLSKCQVFLNGVLLQSGKPGDLALNDFEFENANLQGNPVQIKFSQGLLEEGDYLQVYMSFA